MQAPLLNALGLVFYPNECAFFGKRTFLRVKFIGKRTYFKIWAKRMCIVGPYLVLFDIVV